MQEVQKNKNEDTNAERVKRCDENESKKIKSKS